MGQVYRAFDARLGREVAIKVGEEQFSERLDREVRAVAGLSHPNICIVHDVGAKYLVMDCNTCRTSPCSSALKAAWRSDWRSPAGRAT
jgi:serine/threonine protein kinase